MNFVQKMFLPLVVSYINNNLGLLDALLTPQLVTLLAKNPPFAGNPTLTTQVASDVVAVVKAEIPNLLAKI